MGDMRGKVRSVTVKERVQYALRLLSDDCTFEDIREQLDFLEMLQERINSAENGPFLAHQEVKKRMSKWLTK